MKSARIFFRQNKIILLYALASAVLVFLLKWLQWKFLILDNSVDIYVGLIAVFFTLLGVWVALQIVKPKVKIETVVVKETLVVEKEVFIPIAQSFEPNKAELEKLGLSSRESEVLELINKGLSNTEIAASLFLSVSTIKTHVSNLFLKLDVKSRTQAIEKSKRLGLVR